MVSPTTVRIYQGLGATAHENARPLLLLLPKEMQSCTELLQIAYFNAPVFFKNKTKISSCATLCGTVAAIAAVGCQEVVPHISRPACQSFHEAWVCCCTLG